MLANNGEVLFTVEEVAAAICNFVSVCCELGVLPDHCLDGLHHFKKAYYQYWFNKTGGCGDHRAFALKCETLMSETCEDPGSDRALADKVYEAADEAREMIMGSLVQNINCTN